MSRKLMYCDEASNLSYRLLKYLHDFMTMIRSHRTAYSDIANIGDLQAPITQLTGHSQEIDITDALLEVLLGNLTQSGFSSEETTIFFEWLDWPNLSSFSHEEIAAGWQLTLSTPNHELAPEFAPDAQLFIPPLQWVLQEAEKLCLPQNSRRVGKTCLRQHRVRGS